MKKVLSLLFVAGLAIFLTGCAGSQSSSINSSSTYVDLSTPEKTVKEFYKRLFNDDVGNAMSLLVYYDNLDKSIAEAAVISLRDNFQTKANIMRSMNMTPQNIQIVSKTTADDGIVTIMTTLVDKNGQVIKDGMHLINANNEWKIYKYNK